MTNIVLFCAAGMSTSMLVKKMATAAEKLNYQCTVQAHPIADSDHYYSNADIILLGPQVRYELKPMRAKYPNKLIEVIDMRAYGMLDGDAVIKFVKSKLGN